ncbi:MAG TPA: glucosamine-6-phosphate deaminase [Ruminococcaceae bacterium]|nr:glucosamine-6-phosphate deaminase [Oscillospiraceae bacterium]
MDIKIYSNAEEIGCAAAQLYKELIDSNPSTVLGLATGATPVPTYKKLIELYKNGEISFKDVTTFNLDEYCDLDKHDKNSYYTFMHENLFNYIDIKEENVNFLDGNAKDCDAESKRYAEAIKAAGGIDLQLLGIGTNGHIAFNEPADKFTDEAFKVTLTQSTINSNQKYFGDVPMPRYAMTMGIGSIMRSKKILLIATGESKAKAIKAMVSGEITPQIPCSILNEHKDVVIMLDKAAASLINK